MLDQSIDKKVFSDLLKHYYRKNMTLLNKALKAQDDNTVTAIVAKLEILDEFARAFNIKLGGQNNGK